MSETPTHPPGQERAIVELTVRRADTGDLPAIAALATRFAPDAFDRDASAADRVTYLSPTRSPVALRRVLDESTVLVAELRDRVVGYAQFGPVSIRGVRSAPADLSLQRLQVETARQGRGIGRRLMEAALSHGETAAAPRIFLRVSEHNEPALALYARLGFRRARPHDFTAGVAPGGDMVMVLERSETAATPRRARER